MDRRQFLSQSVLLGATLLAAHPSFPFLSNPLEKEHGYIFFGEGLDAFRFDTKSRILDVMSCGIRAHSFLKLRGHHRLLVVEKWRKNICIIDFSRKKVERVKTAQDHLYFYGHACLSPNHDSIFAIQVDHQTGASFVIKLNSESLEIENLQPLAFGGAHELAFLPDQKTLAIACTGWKPIHKSRPLDFSRVGFSRVVFFNTETGKIISEKILIDPILSLAHLKVTSQGDVILISDIMHSFWSRQMHGKIHSASLNSELMTWPLPDHLKLRGELLSLEINEKSMQIAVTNPIGEKALILSLKDRRLVDVIKTDSRGVSFSEDGHSVFAMAHVESNFCANYQSQTNIIPIPHAGKRASSHSLYIKSFT